jgi:predicted RNase H-like HicB family nuclease
MIVMVPTRYKVILEHEPTGGFSVYVPSLPGCASQGETQAEALANIREAIEAYLLSLQDDHLPIPPDDTILSEVEVGT